MCWLVLVMRRHAQHVGISQSQHPTSSAARQTGKQRLYHTEQGDMEEAGEHSSMLRGNSTPKQENPGGLAYQSELIIPWSYLVTNQQNELH